MKKNKLSKSLIYLTGTISGLNRSRRSHDFILNDIQHQQIGATAIAASALGMGAAGVGLNGMAGNTDEEADWVEFELNGRQMRGWLWMMPMQNGNSVGVVAEPAEDNCYIVYAVKRDEDDLLAVYPHATAGRNVHYRKSVKIWLWCSILGFCLFPLTFTIIKNGFSILLNENKQLVLSISLLGCMLLSSIIGFNVSRKFLKFVRIAEMVFETFGWPHVKDIDLRKTSLENRRENNSPNFGHLYFRYK